LSLIAAEMLTFLIGSVQKQDAVRDGMMTHERAFADILHDVGFPKAESMAQGIRSRPEYSQAGSGRSRRGLRFSSQPTHPRRHVNSLQHCGGARAEDRQRIRQLSPPRSLIRCGARESLFNRERDGSNSASQLRLGDQPDCGSQEDASWSDKQTRNRGLKGSAQST
jgi:hypothetical protein